MVETGNPDPIYINNNELTTEWSVCPYICVSSITNLLGFTLDFQNIHSTVLTNSFRNSNESPTLVNDQSHECHVTNGLSYDQLVPPLGEDEDCESPKPTAKRVTNGFKVPMNLNGTSPTVTKGMDYSLDTYMYM